MKANYVPPKDVTQLTYNVSLQEITRLKAFDQRSKVINEHIFNKTIVNIKCGKQSDHNYKKWDSDTNRIYILNFNHKGIHVYVRLLHITRVSSKEFGLRYKILVSAIKELPK